MTVNEVKQYINECVYIKHFCQHASDIHSSVNQKYDEYPYAYHVRNVINQVIHGLPSILKDEDFEHYTPIILFGAAFHDTIEDCRLTYNDVLKIAKKYLHDDSDATMATEIVYALTNEKGRNRDERANDKYYEGIRTTMFAPFVKYCDRMANMKYSKKTGSSMYKKYLSEMPHFLESINGNDVCLSLIGVKNLDYYKVPVFTSPDDVTMEDKVFS